MFVPAFAAVTLAIWLVVPGRTSNADAVNEFSWETLRALRRGINSRTIPIIVGVQITSSFLIQGFSSFYPAYLIETKALSAGMAATLFGGFFAVGAVIQATSGSVMDRVGVQPTLVGCLVSCVTALWLLPFVGGLVPIIIVTALFAAWNGTIVVTQTHIADSLPAEIQGTGFGALKASWMLLGATAPIVVGVLADIGRFDEAFLLLAAVGSIGLSLAIFRL